MLGRHLKNGQVAAAKGGAAPKVNKHLEQQFNLLQETVGNKKVQEMVKTGALPVDLAEASSYEMADAKRTRVELERVQIEKDREALMPEIMKEAERDKETLEKLKMEKPGEPIYVNAEVELVYANIPGEKEAMNIYHYTKIAKVSLSYKNINEQKDAREVPIRTKIVPVTFSVLFDENKVEENKEEELKDALEQRERTEQMEGGEGAEGAEGAEGGKQGATKGEKK